MASTADIRDERVREALVGIETLIDDGAYASACKNCAELYVEYLREHPDPPNVGNDPAQFGAAHGILWPRTGGVNVRRDESGVPSASYDKERFSMSEALTYFEFVLEFLSKHQD